MTVNEALKSGADALAKAGVPDPKIDTAYMLCFVTGFERMTLSLQNEAALTRQQEQAFLRLLLERSRRVPLQYLLGTQCFFGREFQVDPNVLIPRPETELLCEQALCAVGALEAPEALDLCTGSGAIAVTLKLERPDMRVSACDISDSALHLARRNALDNGADIAFYQGDLFEPLAGKRFDLIVSNPPYIASGECERLQPEVRSEPRLALDGGEDGLAFYRRILTDAPAYLKPSGVIALEIGQTQAQAIKTLMARQYRSVRVLPDLQGLPRMALCTLSD